MVSYFLFYSEKICKVTVNFSVKKMGGSQFLLGIQIFFVIVS